MYYKEDKEIIDYLLDKYPEEGCGLLLNKKGKLQWIPCDNTADNPEEDFIISASDYIQASLKGDIHAIVHSHPDAPAELSETDKKASDFLGIPYIVFSVPELEKVEYKPQKLREPLIGRDYEFGFNDCYSLARDYYEEKLNLVLPTMPFEDDWWDKGLNYFDDLFEAYGFVEVKEPQEHDAIIFRVYCNVPNHCGIYLGEDIFLHHAINRMSCRESLHSGWGKHVERYIRCKQFI